MTHTHPSASLSPVFAPLKAIQRAHHYFLIPLDDSTPPEIVCSPLQVQSRAMAYRKQRTALGHQLPVPT